MRARVVEAFAAASGSSGLAFPTVRDAAAAVATSASAVLTFGLLLALGWLLSGRLAGAEGALRRTAAWCTTTLAVAFALFALTASVGQFRAPVVVFVLLLGVALHLRGVPPRDLRADVERWLDGVAEGLRLRGMPCAVLCLAAIPLGWRALASLVTPILDWDSLTYHLVRAAQWVRTGSLARHAAPDAWGYCEMYPLHGDAPWAWALLPSRDELWVAVASLAVGLAAIVGFLALGRELELPRETLVPAACVLALVPAVESYLGTAYVDVAFLAAFLLANAHALRFRRGGRWGDLALALAAAAWMAGTKDPGLLTAALVVASLLPRALALVRRRQRPGAAEALGLAAALVGFAATPLWRFVVAGSPAYPLRLPFADLPWNAQGMRILASDEGVPLARLLRALALGATGPGTENLSLGLVAFLILPLGVAGAVVLARRRATRVAVAWLVVQCAALVLAYGSPAVRELWIALIGSSGRFVTAVVACALLFAAAVPLGALRFAWIGAVAWSAWIAMPRRYGGPIPEAALPAAVALLALAAVLAVAARRRTPGALVGAAAVLVLAAASLSVLRDATRREARHAARAGRLHVVYPLPAGSIAVEAWDALERAPPRRLAASAGWALGGQNWFRWPLFGRRLQHAVEYVPVTADGAVLDYALGPALDPRTSREAWLARLHDGRFDGIVLMDPNPPWERRWIAELPAIFRHEAGASVSLHAIDRAALAAHLGRPPDDE